MIYKDAINSASQTERGDDSWTEFSDSFHASVGRLGEMVNDVSEMRENCRDEWCDAAECLLGEATTAAFAVSEPHWALSEDSRKLKDLKKRIHDLHGWKH